MTQHSIPPHNTHNLPNHSLTHTPQSTRLPLLPLLAGSDGRWCHDGASRSVTQRRAPPHAPCFPYGTQPCNAKRWRASWSGRGQSGGGWGAGCGREEGGYGPGLRARCRARSVRGRPPPPGVAPRRHRDDFETDAQYEEYSRARVKELQRLRESNRGSRKGRSHPKQERRNATHKWLTRAMRDAGWKGAIPGREELEHGLPSPFWLCKRARLLEIYRQLEMPVWAGPIKKL